MTCRFLSSPHQAHSSFTDCVEDDEKQKAWHEHSKSQGEAGGLQKGLHIAGSSPRKRCAFGRRSSSLIHRLKSLVGSNALVDEGKNRLVRQKCRPKFQERLISVVRRFCCVLWQPKSGSDVNICPQTKSDDPHSPEQVSNNPGLAHWPKGGNRVDDNVSTEIYEIGADSAIFSATVIQRSGAPSVENLVLGGAQDDRVVDESIAAEVFITVDLGGPDGPSEVLGGLSLAGFEQIVFSICPHLSD
ncbi:hypothetical protein M758_5G093500 [Ceratodon purpureus]|nr:hypothetical protein M758_5G093500 [Ceratodon purpureus]